MNALRPWPILRWMAALYAFAFGAGLLCAFSWELLQHGAMILEARAVPKALTGWDVLGMMSWLVACIITGWDGMQREAS